MSKLLNEHYGVKSGKPVDSSAGAGKQCHLYP